MKLESGKTYTNCSQHGLPNCIDGPRVENVTVKGGLFYDPIGVWKGAKLIDPPHVALINGCKDVILDGIRAESDHPIGDVFNLYSDAVGLSGPASFCQFVQLLNPRIKAPIWRHPKDPDIGTDVCVDGTGCGGRGILIKGGGCLNQKSRRLYPYRVIGIHAGHGSWMYRGDVPKRWMDQADRFGVLTHLGTIFVPAVILWQVDAKIVELDGIGYPGCPERQIGEVWVVDCQIDEFAWDRPTCPHVTFKACDYDERTRKVTR